MKINKLITIFTSKYILNVLGIIMLVYFLWYRFLRERLPKNIPFELSELGLYIIICICCIYIYILLRIFKPRPPNITMQMLLQPLSKLYTPWLVLDETIKNNKYIKRFYPEVLIGFPRYVHFYKNVSLIYKLYIILNIIPRILLLIIFCIDVFYFHRIEYIYKFSFLILYILICNYIIYSIKKTTQECINYLNEWYLVEIISEDTEDSDYYVPIDSIVWYDDSRSNFDAQYGVDNRYLEVIKFLELQSAAIAFDNTPYSYISCPKLKLREKYATENNLAFNEIQFNMKEIDLVISKIFYELMPITIHLYLAIDTYNYVVSSHKNIKKLSISITLTYLICWVYVLSISFNIKLLDSILNILDKIEPFSGLVI